MLKLTNLSHIEAATLINKLRADPRGVEGIMLVSADRSKNFACCLQPDFENYYMDGRGFHWGEWQPKDDNLHSKFVVSKGEDDGNAFISFKVEGQWNALLHGNSNDWRAYGGLATSAQELADWLQNVFCEKDSFSLYGVPANYEERESISRRQAELNTFTKHLTDLVDDYKINPIELATIVAKFTGNK